MSSATAMKKDLANKANGSYDKTVKYRLLGGKEFVFSEEDVKKPDEPQKSISEALGCELQEVRIVGNDVVISSKGKKRKGKGKEIRRHPQLEDNYKDPTDEEIERWATESLEIYSIEVCQMAFDEECRRITTSL